ncbi:MAG: barstar family protein [Pelistega sp.]|nr:barstar family protein [Pelistega sp.]
MSKKINFVQELAKSGELPKTLLKQQEELTAKAAEMGLAVFTADCSKARNLSALLRAFAKAVDYPVFFGKDIDALLDCLKETLAEQKQGYLLLIQEIHSGDPDLKEDVDAVLAILHEATEYATKKDKKILYLIDHAGKHSAPEPGRGPTGYTDVE